MDHENWPREIIYFHGHRSWSRATTMKNQKTSLSPFPSFSFLFPPSLSSSSFFSFLFLKFAMKKRRRHLVLMLGLYMCLHILISPICEHASTNFTRRGRNWQFSACFWRVWDEKHKAFGVWQDKVDLWIDCCWIYTPKGNSRKEHDLIPKVLWHFSSKNHSKLPILEHWPQNGQKWFFLDSNRRILY